MRKVLLSILVFFLVSLLAISPVWAKSYSFKLHSEASLNGVTLKPGKYKVHLNGDDEAEIFRMGKFMTKAKVELKPLVNGDLPNSTKVKGGQLQEIRLKKQCVVFIG
jgi:hypothetical protein